MSEQSKVRSVQDMESIKKFLSANMDKNFKLIMKESLKSSKNKTREEKQRNAYNAVTSRYSKAEMKYNKFMYSAYYYMRIQDRIKQNGGLVTEEDYKRLSYLSGVVASQDVSSSIPEKDKNKDKELLSQPMLLTQRIFQHEEKKMERYVKEVAKFPVEMSEMYGYADRKELEGKIDPKNFKFGKVKKFAENMKEYMDAQQENLDKSVKEFEEVEQAVNELNDYLAQMGDERTGEDVLKVGELLNKVVQAGASYKEAVNPDGKTMPDTAAAQRSYSFINKMAQFATVLANEFPSEKSLENPEANKEMDKEMDGPSLEDRLVLSRK